MVNILYKLHSFIFQVTSIRTSETCWPRSW